MRMAVIKTSRTGDYRAMAEGGVVMDLPKNGGPHVVTKTFVNEYEREAVDKVAEEETCGWGPFRPALCQRFRDPKWVLFWLCWAGAIQVRFFSFITFNYRYLKVESYSKQLISQSKFSGPRKFVFRYKLLE